MFDDWEQFRIDVEAAAGPNLVADITDLSAIESETIDAVWAAHCVEHLYMHQVRAALSEFQRVLNPHGFACIIVPDLQAIAHYMIEDRLHETVYRSAAGPVSAHDILFGFGPAIAHGQWRMAHHCGFTPALLRQRLAEIGFGESIIFRRPNLELATIVSKQPFADAAERDALLARLGL
jgi:hypothetical protein